MLRIGKPGISPLANVKLPQMQSVPGKQDLQVMLSRAQRNWRVGIELPFKYAGAQYVLTVKCDLGTGEPCWMLYRNDESDSRLIWNYASADTYVLCSLIHTECAAAAAGSRLVADQAPEAAALEAGLPDSSPAADSQTRATAGRQDEQLLTDQWEFLLAAGVSLDAYILRKNAHLSDQEFNFSLLDRGLCRLEDLKAFYDLVDDKSTLEELLARQPMSREQWVPLLYNLVTRSLVTGAGSLPTGPAAILQELSQAIPDAVPKADVVPIDDAVTDSVTELLSSRQTGMFSYPALAYFLKQEHLRFARGGQPFALLVFEMGTHDRSHTKDLRVLPIQSVREVASRIKAGKRELDLLGHCQGDFALLLPHTDLQGAVSMARRLEHLICGDPLMNTIHADQILTHIGVAAMPEDCQDAGELLKAARQAKDLAKSHEQSIVSFKQRGQLSSTQ